MKQSIFHKKNNKCAGGQIIERMPNDVYYVRSDDDTVLIGMGVENIHEDSNTLIRWFDTVKERRMYAETTTKHGADFSFTRVEREGGQFYIFTPMTLEIYRNDVKCKLRNGEDYDCLETLTKAFMDTKDIYP